MWRAASCRMRQLSEQGAYTNALHAADGGIQYWDWKANHLNIIGYIIP